MTRLRALAPAYPAMDRKRLQDLVAGPHHRVEGEFRVLQDHGDLLAAHVAASDLRHRQQRSWPMNAMRSALDFARPRDEPQDRAPGRGSICPSRISPTMPSFSRPSSKLTFFSAWTVPVGVT